MFSEGVFVSNHKILFIVVVLFMNIANAGLDITIHNKALDKVYAATYYSKVVQDSIKATRVSEVLEIPAEDQIKNKKPELKVTYNRSLLFSYKKETLAENIEGLMFKNISKIPIGAKHGNSFYIVPEGSILVGYKFLRWNLIEKTKDFLNKRLSYITSFYEKTKPGDNREAQVRVSKDLPKEELNYLNERRTVTKKAIEKLTGLSINNNSIPNIAVCASGGGYRAMQAALGLFMGLERTKLLDTITYAAGLSGSTWFITPWLYYDESVKDYKKRLKPKVSISLGKKIVRNKGKFKIKTDFPLQEFIKYAVLKNKIFNQKLTSVDIYGSLLVDKLFSDLKRSKRHQIRLSSLGSKIEKGNKPFPILTAVQPGPPFTWFELTPYEVGPSLENSFIPIWALGRKFLNGKSQDKDFEETLGFYMAIWGSAYTATLQELLGEMGASLPESLTNWIDSTLVLLGGTNKRISPAKLDNFNYGFKDVPLVNMKELILIDAGLHYNLPFPPLLRSERKVDIIIVCDASASAHEGAPAVKEAEKWAKENGLKFPEIDYNVIGKEIYSIFKDDNDPSVPTIIYFSLVKNSKFSTKFDPVKEIKDGFCNTFNFVYKPEEFELLTGLMEFNLMRAEDAIKKEIIDKINAKKMMK